MSADTLAALAAGHADPAGLWGAARLEGGAGEAFGAEAIAAALRADPFPQPFHAAAHGRLVGLFADGQALLGETRGGVIARLWRVGGPVAGLAEPGVFVAFDPDLAQARGDVFAPALPAGLADAVGRHGRALLETTPAFRARAFALRAAGGADAGMALFVLHIVPRGAMRRPQQARAAVAWGLRNAGAVAARDAPSDHGALVRLVV